MDEQLVGDLQESGWICVLHVIIVPDEAGIHFLYPPIKSLDAPFLRRFIKIQGYR